jgi:16S rRNA (guanine966-N2)-methyltransferase
MFSTLASLLDVAGASVLDLYAGSGALGLEALSRGADNVTFVESDPVAAAQITANAEALGLSGATVLRQPVRRFVRAPARHYDLVFADPPYDLAAEDLATVLSALVGQLSAGAVVVVERSSRDPDWHWPKPLVALRVRRYGAGALWYGRRP